MERALKGRLEETRTAEFVLLFENLDGLRSGSLRPLEASVFALAAGARALILVMDVNPAGASPERVADRHAADGIGCMDAIVGQTLAVVGSAGVGVGGQRNYQDSGSAGQSWARSKRHDCF